MSCSPLLVPLIRSMSSAKCSLHIGLLWEEWWSWRLFRMVFSEKDVELIGHPSRTSVVGRKKSPILLSNSNELIDLLYGEMKEALFNFECLYHKLCHGPLCKTLSKAFSRSMELWLRSRWCCRCCFFYRNVTCSFEGSSSVVMLMRLCITFSSSSSWF